ncbi:Uncharacterised protein [Mycobacteroides abscessus]|nr:Uncharacterised protein [Mycobacteroides abscessus]
MTCLCLGACSRRTDQHLGEGEGVEDDPVLSVLEDERRRLGVVHVGRVGRSDHDVRVGDDHSSQPARTSSR